MADYSGDLKWLMELNIDTVGASRDLLSLAEKTKDKFSEAITQAVKLGTKRYAKVELDLKAMAAGLLQARKDADAKARELEQKGLTEVERNRIQAEFQVAVARQKAMEKTWDREMKHWDRRKKAEEEMAERLGDAYEKAGWRLTDQMSQGVKTLGEGVEDVFDTLSRKDWGSVLGLTGKLAQLNQAAAEKAKDMAAGRGGATGKILEGISGFLGKLGPALTAIAGIAAGIAAVVKVLVDADAMGKEFNRTLLEMGMTGGDLKEGFKDVVTVLNETRNAFAGQLSFNRIWGTTAKDHLEVLAAYSEAGLTLQEVKAQLSGVADEQERLRDATAASMTYSKLLGMSSKEVASTFANYMEELGLTLQGVEKRFSSLLSVARESGYGVKRFFSMITQATSGMSLYNIRLAEAAGLLTSLGKILGEKLGAEFFGKLAQGLRGESFDEAYRKTLLMGTVKRGGRNVSRGAALGADEARMQAKEFGRMLQEFMDTASPESKKFMEALEKAGLAKGGQALGPEAFVQQLNQMSQGQRNELGAILGRYNAGLGRFLTTIAGAAVGEKGTVGAGAAARAYLGPGGTLLAKAYSAFAVTGKRLDEISDEAAEQVIAIEHLSGEQAEDRRQMARVLREFAGRQESILRVQREIQKAGPGTKAAEEAAASFNREFGKAWNVYLDKFGKRYTDENLGAADQIGDTFDELVRSTATEKEATVSEDLMVAKDIARETTEITKILEQGVEKLLSGIYDVVQDIYWSLPWVKTRLTPEHAAERDKALRLMDKERSEIRAERARVDRELTEIKRGKPKTAEEAVAQRERIREKESALRELDEREKEVEDKKKRILGIQAEDDLRGATTAEEILQTMTFSPEEAAVQAAGEAAVEELRRSAGQGTLHPDDIRETRRNAEEVKRRELLLHRQTRREDKVELWPAVSKMLARDIVSEQKAAQVMEIAGILQRGGLSVESAAAMATQLMGLGGTIGSVEDITPKTARSLVETGFLPPDIEELLRGRFTAPPAKDLVVSGGRVQRIDNRDDIIAFQKGGPVSQALSRGTTVNNISLIGAGPRDLLQGLINAMEVGVV